MEQNKEVKKERKVRKRAVPLGWELRISNKYGVPYYYNCASGETQWEKPIINSMLPKSRVSSLSSADNVSKRPPGIMCSHILIKHVFSAKPFSPQGSRITRPKEEALRLIKEIHSRIVSKEFKFEVAALIYSDCKTFKQCGRFGPIIKGKFLKELEEVAYALQLGEISEPIDTVKGYHIVKRIQ